MVLFYERIGFLDYVMAIARRRRCYYSTMSGATKFLDWFIKRFRNDASPHCCVNEFGWGDTEFVGHAVRDAACNAKSHLQQFAPVWLGIAAQPLPAREIDLAGLLKKYLLVEVLYRKYFFFELVLRYAEECRSEEVVVVADKRFAAPYEKRLTGPGLRVRWKNGQTGLATLLALVALPLLMPLNWRRKVEPDAASAVNGVVCNVENPRMLEGYLQLLQPEINPSFVVAPEYRSGISPNQFPDARIVQLGLSESSYRELVQLIGVYGRAAARSFKAVSCLGWHVLRFANQLVHGRIRAPSGEGYHLLACEHHDLTKTIRNEFIRKHGGKSILFPYSSLYVLRFHADEFFENYDYVLSPGRHYEDTLRENESPCTKIFTTGTYAVHKHGVQGENQARERRLHDVRAFVGTDRVVTVLCPGVCKPTYPSEVKLMQLAQSLSKIKGVKVIVRQKPFIPEPEYEGFYERFVEGNPSILLTGMEYELFDFLPVTDLFVTSYSTSACELAVCGADVLFVECLKQEDRFIFWKREVAGSLLVNNEEAIVRVRHILETASDEEGGYRRDMARFANYIGYRFDDYESYRANLMGVFERGVGIRIREMAH